MKAIAIFNPTIPEVSTEHRGARAFLAIRPRRLAVTFDNASAPPDHYDSAHWAPRPRSTHCNMREVIEDE
jgi:hypothetical protein